MSQYRIVRISDHDAPVYLDNYDQPNGIFTWTEDGVHGFPFDDREDAASYLKEFADGVTLLHTDTPVPLATVILDSIAVAKKTPKVMKRPVVKQRASKFVVVAEADDAQTASDFQQFSNQVCIVEIDDCGDGDTGADVVVGVVYAGKDGDVVVVNDDGSRRYEAADVEHITPLAA